MNKKNIILTDTFCAVNNTNKGNLYGVVNITYFGFTLNFVCNIVEEFSDPILFQFDNIIIAMITLI